MGLIESNLCSFCSLAVETIPHLFWDCPVTHRFIVDLQTYVLDNISIDCNAFLFGSVKLTRYVNFVLIYAKYFIYSVKTMERILDINLFKHSLEQITRIEHYIAMI